MSELCVSPLSNVVAGSVDPGCPANKLELPSSRAIKSAPIGFIFVEVKLAGVSAPGYRRSGGRYHFWLGASGVHSVQQLITNSQCVGNDGERRIHRTA